jgi:hypothetical protein
VIINFLSDRDHVLILLRERIDPLEMRTILKERLIRRDQDNEAEDLLEYWIDGETDSNGIRTPHTLSKDPSSIHRVGIFEISGIFIYPIVLPKI